MYGEIVFFSKKSVLLILLYVGTYLPEYAMKRFWS